MENGIYIALITALSSNQTVHVNGLAERTHQRALLSSRLPLSSVTKKKKKIKSRVNLTVFSGTKPPSRGRLTFTKSCKDTREHPLAATTVEYEKNSLKTNKTKQKNARWCCFFTQALKSLSEKPFLI